MQKAPSTLFLVTALGAQTSVAQPTQPSSSQATAWGPGAPAQRAPAAPRVANVLPLPCFLIQGADTTRNTTLWPSQAWTYLHAAVPIERLPPNTRVNWTLSNDRTHYNTSARTGVLELPHGQIGDTSIVVTQADGWWLECRVTATLPEASTSAPNPARARPERRPLGRAPGVGPGPGPQEAAGQQGGGR